MNKPILSICIPTYNRAEYLIECLNNITCQFNNSDISKNIEIIISDNASDDETEKMVKKYQKKFENIFYFKNESNLGYDRNVERVIYLAKGNFIWTLSDDEIIKQNSLTFLFSVFKNYPEVAWICIDDRDNSVLNTYKYENGDHWLRTMGLMGNTMSSNIYNRNYLPVSIEKYIGNLWIHYSLAREISLNTESLLIKNLFKYTAVNRPCRWANNGQAFFTYINLKKIVENLIFLGYDKKIIGIILKSMAKGLPKQVASAKIHGLKNNLRNFKFLFVSFYSYPLWLIMAIVIFYTPSKILLKVKLLLMDDN